MAGSSLLSVLDWRQTVEMFPTVAKNWTMFCNECIFTAVFMANEARSHEPASSKNVFLFGETNRDAPENLKKTLACVARRERQVKTADADGFL